MKIKSQRDFWAGLLFLALGVAFALGASEHAMGSSTSPGPGYLSLALSALMVVLGALVLFLSLTFETDGGNPIGPIAWRPLWVITTAVVMFGLALPRWGLVITCLLTVAWTSFAVGKPHWPGLWWSCLLTPLAAYLLFVLGLRLPIPI